MRRWILVAAAVVVLMGVATWFFAANDTGGPSSSTDSRRGQHWRTEQELEASWGPLSGQSGGEYRPMQPPQAHLGRADINWPSSSMHHGLERGFWPRRFIINEDDHRRVYFKQYEFDFRTERALASVALREAIAESLGVDEDRDAQGVSMVPVLLHLGRRPPWEDVQGFLALVDPPLRLERVQLSVHRVSRHVDRRVDLRVTPFNASSPGERNSVRLARKEAATVVGVGAREFAFPPGDRFDDAEFVQRANRTWDAIESELRALSSERPVHLHTDGAHDVSWAYFVKMLDLLAIRGVRVVILPDEKKQIEILPASSGP